MYLRGNSAELFFGQLLGIFAQAVDCQTGACLTRSPIC